MSIKKHIEVIDAIAIVYDTTLDKVTNFVSNEINDIVQKLNKKLAK